MSKPQKESLGKYIEVFTDYHSNGSYEVLKNHVELLDKKNYAIMIRTLNLERNDFSKDLLYITREAYDFLEKSKVYPNDILMNKIANPGSLYIMPDLGEKVSCGMNLFLIRFKKTVDQRYMYYCMKNSEAYIKSLAHGTTTKTITKEEVRDIELAIFTKVEYQKKIANLLTAIDEKIEKNNEINDNLQQMAFTTYMHLFFKKKPNGKLCDILLENEKSPIQVGEAKNSSGVYPFFTSGDAILEWQDYLVDGRNCFLNTGGNADVKFYVGKAAYSTDTWCVTAKYNLTDYMYLLLFSIKLELNKKFFQGTGLKHLQKPLLKDRGIYIPSENEIKAFNEQILPKFSLISENIRENQRLTALRNWLLPMLMNGQAVVTD